MVTALTCWEPRRGFGVYEFVGDLEYLWKWDGLASKQQVEFIKKVLFICESVALKEHCVPGRKGSAETASSALFSACSSGCV